jgi:cell division inhibitor SepF
MSFWDNVKKFAQPYADDEYDDYDEEEYLDDYEEPAEAPRRAPVRRSRPAPAPIQDEEEDDDFGFGLTASASPAPAATSGNFSGQVLKMGGAKQEVVLFRPVSFNETSKAADHLKNNKAVVLNLEEVDKAMARRVVDILSGAVYALEGDVTKIAKSAYLFYPKNMDVSGTLESLAEEIESYT